MKEQENSFNYFRFSDKSPYPLKLEYSQSFDMFDKVNFQPKILKKYASVILDGKNNLKV